MLSISQVARLFFWIWRGRTVMSVECCRLDSICGSHTFNCKTLFVRDVVPRRDPRLLHMGKAVEMKVPVVNYAGEVSESRIL